MRLHAGQGCRCLEEGAHKAPNGWPEGPAPDGGGDAADAERVCQEGDDQLLRDGVWHGKDAQQKVLVDQRLPPWSHPDCLDGAIQRERGRPCGCRGTWHTMRWWRSREACSNGSAWRPPFQEGSNSTAPAALSIPGRRRLQCSTQKSFLAVQHTNAWEGRAFCGAQGRRGVLPMEKR